MSPNHERRGRGQQKKDFAIAHHPAVNDMENGSPLAATARPAVGGGVTSGVSSPSSASSPASNTAVVSAGGGGGGASAAVAAAATVSADEASVRLPGCLSSFFEYETPKVVTIQNVPLGILRLALQARHYHGWHIFSPPIIHVKS